MGFDLNALERAVTEHGRVGRVVITGIQGSSPREIGASMLVWQGGQSGTIGGGALEFELAKSALNVADKRLSRHALGPELGQCCGGALQIVTEVFEQNTLPTSRDGVVVRAVDGSHTMPLRVQKLLKDARGGALIETHVCQGWFIEAVHKTTRALWVWGAGHVGRALVNALAPLPEFATTWIDTSEDRFPNNVPEDVTKLPAQNPAALVKHAPKNAEHIILTYSHALDLELCHQLLTHDFQFAGLIGSKSKWARFQSRLAALGHSNAQISRITCPIGNPVLGKHPQAIAIGVGSSLLKTSQTVAQTQRNSA